MNILVLLCMKKGKNDYTFVQSSQTHYKSILTRNPYCEQKCVATLFQNLATCQQGGLLLFFVVVVFFTLLMKLKRDMPTAWFVILCGGTLLLL